MIYLKEKHKYSDDIIEDVNLDDPLAKYNQTNLLYQKIRTWYLKKDITINTPLPVLATYINQCIYIHRQKPSQKVLYLTFKFLDEMGYQWQ